MGVNMETVICSQCNGLMERYEDITREGKIIRVDWTTETPICPVCRGVPGAKNVQRKRDVLGGFPWKRDEQGRKVPR
jgi:hypothetical protein